MQPKLRTLLLILSLSMNGAFFAVWFANAAPAWLSQSATATREAGDVWSPLHREIGVSCAQWQAIAPRLLQFQQDAQEQRKVIAELRGQVIDLLSSPQAAKDEIRAKQDEVLSAMRSMQDMVIAHFFVEKALLSPEQQKMMFDIARKNNGSGCKTLSLEEPKTLFGIALAGN